MNGQRDVDVPGCLRHRLGSLLARLETYLRSRVVKQWRVDKEPGGHVTPWWIYAQLSPAAESSSVVVFGETDHAAVNAAPHLWTRGKENWIGCAYDLLREFVSAERRAAEPPPPPQPPLPPGTYRARADFNGFQYGPGYLVLREGGLVLPREAPAGADPGGWAYGRCVATGALGWYPPDFATA